VQENSIQSWQTFFNQLLSEIHKETASMLFWYLILLQVILNVIRNFNKKIFFICHSTFFSELIFVSHDQNNAVLVNKFYTVPAILRI